MIANPIYIHTFFIIIIIFYYDIISLSWTLFLREYVYNILRLIENVRESAEKNYKYKYYIYTNIIFINYKCYYNNNYIIINFNNHKQSQISFLKIRNINFEQL